MKRGENIKSNMCRKRKTKKVEKSVVIILNCKGESKHQYGLYPFYSPFIHYHCTPTFSHKTFFPVLKLPTFLCPNYVIRLSYYCTFLHSELWFKMCCWTWSLISLRRHTRASTVEHKLILFNTIQFMKYQIACSFSENELCALTNFY